MEKIEDVLQYYNPEEILKYNSTIKKTSTQLDTIRNSNKRLITDKDYKTLQQAEMILDKIVRKRDSFAKKIKNENLKKENHIKKNIKQLEVELKDITDKEKVAYILAVDRNAFDWNNNLDETFDVFLNTMAKVMYSGNHSALKAKENLDIALNDTTHIGYKKHQDKLAEILKKLVI